MKVLFHFSSVNGRQKKSTQRRCKQLEFFLLYFQQEKHMIIDDCTNETFLTEKHERSTRLITSD